MIGLGRHFQLIFLLTIFLTGASVALAETGASTAQCSVIINDVRDSQIHINMENCTVYGLPENRAQQATSKNLKRCSCSVKAKFVLALEREISRMSRGVSEVPDFNRAYAMILNVMRQTPGCCHAQIVKEVLQSKTISCKIKLVANSWSTASDRSEEFIVSLAAQRFRSATPSEC